MKTSHHNKDQATCDTIQSLKYKPLLSKHCLYPCKCNKAQSPHNQMQVYCLCCWVPQHFPQSVASSMSTGKSIGLMIVLLISNTIHRLQPPFYSVQYYCSSKPPMASNVAHEPSMHWRLNFLGPNVLPLSLLVSIIWSCYIMEKERVLKNNNNNK